MIKIVNGIVDIKNLPTPDRKTYKHYVRAIKTKKCIMDVHLNTDGEAYVYISKRDDILNEHCDWGLNHTSSKLLNRNLSYQKKYGGL